MAEFGFLLLLIGFGLIIWGGAELAHQTGAGLPPNPIAMIVLFIFAVFRTKSGLMGVICMFIGMFIATSGIGIGNRVWQNKQNAIQIEVTGSPSLGQIQEYGGETTRDVMVNVKVTNSDSKSHDLCIEAGALADLPEIILQEYLSSNPIEWWGITWDTQVNECQFHIDGNSTRNISIGIGGGSGGHWAGDPSPLALNNISDVTFVQFCAHIRYVDGKNTVPIVWKQYPSPTCRGY
jgi:hypothetical protein